MGILEILLLGLALSADAMSVTACNVLACPHMTRPKRWAMPLFFGLFQGIMPLLGFFAGSVVANVIDRYAGIVSLVILGVLGLKMIWDAFHEDEESEKTRDIGYGALILQAIATSIDAFIVGVALVAGNTEIFSAAALIAVCTFVCCAIVLQVGKRLSSHFGQKAQIIGGIVLILIGVKAMFF